MIYTVTCAQCDAIKEIDTELVLINVSEKIDSYSIVDDPKESWDDLKIRSAWNVRKAGDQYSDRLRHVVERAVADYNESVEFARKVLLTAVQLGKKEISDFVNNLEKIWPAHDVNVIG